jgi:hypothetical protein
MKPIREANLELDNGQMRKKLNMRLFKLEQLKLASEQRNSSFSMLKDEANEVRKLEEKI